VGTCYCTSALCLISFFFNDLDHNQSDCDNTDYPINLFGVPIYQQEHINDEFGLFNDDDDEDNLTLFGKMIIMIKLREKKNKRYSNRISIILVYA